MLLNPRHFPARAQAFALAVATLLLPGLRASGPDEGFRAIHLSEDREGIIRSDVERALTAALGEQVENVSLGLSRPELLRRGDEFHLRFAEGSIGLSSMDVSGIEVNGTIRFEDLVLDYAELGVGCFRLVRDPRVHPDLSTSLAQLEEFMAEQGLQDTFLRFDPVSGELELGGRRPVRVLFVRVTPLVTVRGKFTVEDNHVGFAISSIDVDGASGPIASGVVRRVREIASRTVNLDEVLKGLVVERIRLGGGSVRVESGSRVLFAHKLPISIPASAG